MKSPIQTAIPLSASPTESGSAGSMLFTVSSALVAVLLLIVAVAWLARRFGLASAAPKSHKLMQVKGSLSLGPRERVVLIEVADSWLVVGVSPAGMTQLSTLEKPEKEEAACASKAPADFQSVFKNLLTTARREKK